MIPEQKAIRSKDVARRFRRELSLVVIVQMACSGPGLLGFLVSLHPRGSMLSTVWAMWVVRLRSKANTLADCRGSVEDPKKGLLDTIIRGCI
jgi:hypothetical protein